MLLRPAPTSSPVPPRAPLPGDVRLMNALAAWLFVLFAVLVLAEGARWMARRPLFAFDRLRLEGDLQHNNVTTVRANALPHLAGNYFTMNLAQARDAFEQVPWVRHAVVRRVWPDRLVVTLEEHHPVALWTTDADSDRMVNTHGEVFEANVGDVEDQGLPEFSGPEGSAPQVLAMYQRLQPVFHGLDADISVLTLSGRGSWHVELDSGATVELGRGAEDEVVERCTRFVRTVPQVLNRFHAPLQSADLRNAEGYAVRLKGLTTQQDAKPPAVAAAREQ